MRNVLAQLVTLNVASENYKLLLIVACFIHHVPKTLFLE